MHAMCLPGTAYEQSCNRHACWQRAAVQKTNNTKGLTGSARAELTLFGAVVSLVGRVAVPHDRRHGNTGNVTGQGHSVTL